MVYIFLADGFEEIEAVATIDILRRAGVGVCLVSASGAATVTGAHGIGVNADKRLSEISAEDAQALVFPGGMPGTENLKNNAKLKALTLECARRGVKLAAICAAPSVLGTWGLLKGKKAVCFPGFEDQLEGAQFTDNKVVNDAGVITSKGAGTAHEFAFEIVRVLKGAEIASKIRKAMQYE